MVEFSKVCRALQRTDIPLGLGPTVKEEVNVAHGGYRDLCEKAFAAARKEQRTQGYIPPELWTEREIQFVKQIVDKKRTENPLFSSLRLVVMGVEHPWAGVSPLKVAGTTIYLNLRVPPPSLEILAFGIDHEAGHILDRYRLAGDVSQPWMRTQVARGEINRAILLEYLDILDRNLESAQDRFVFQEMRAELVGDAKHLSSQEFMATSTIVMEIFRFGEENKDPRTIEVIKNKKKYKVPEESFTITTVRGNPVNLHQHLVAARKLELEIPNREEEYETLNPWILEFFRVAMRGAAHWQLSHSR